MRLVDDFSLQEHEEEYENRPLKSQLFYCGEDIGVKVLGYVIDQQFELIDYFLLFINWDCPFEEGCEIVVLNKRFNVVGKHSFNAFYHSYLLNGVTELSKNRYELAFNKADFFELVINYPKEMLFTQVVKVAQLNMSQL